MSPDVLAYVDADAYAVERKDRRFLAGSEVALFIEDTVVGQQVLVVTGKYLAIPEHETGIEDFVILKIARDLVTSSKT